VIVERRFNGPLESGQGGYSAGLLAGRADGAVEVSLRAPVPLETPLTVAPGEDGELRLLSGEALVADAAPAKPFADDVPDPVGAGAAHDATHRYRGDTDGPFSRCFVCGLERTDGFHVHPGAVAGRELVASPWTPPSWAADDDGAVRPEFVWAVLDCPATFAAAQIGVLARFSVRIHAPVEAGREHVVVGWPLADDGRKQHAGSALFTAGGELLAASRALLIVPRT
jgi:hypothetical protein